jgi:hypothetical protein
MFPTFPCTLATPELRPSEGRQIRSMLSVLQDDWSLQVIPCSTIDLAKDLASAQERARRALAAPVGRWGWKGVCLGDLIEARVTADEKDPAVVTRLTRKNPPTASLARMLWRAVTGPSWSTLNERFHVGGMLLTIEANLAKHRALQAKVAANLRLTQAALADYRRLHGAAPGIA